jgi:ABC-type multidrug transport system ATPase subunit
MTKIKTAGMTIQLTDAGKRFNRDWIFRHVTYTFEPGHTYAITGPNGSGKSTLLQVIAGSMEASEGKSLHHLRSGDVRSNDLGNVSLSSAIDHLPSPIDPESVYRYISIAAPYLEVIEEMTALEFFRFHADFKPFLPGLSPENIVQLADLDKAAHKQIRYYSSGMKQRVKLAQAIFTNSPLLLLDEPCTNLDQSGYQLYHHLVQTYTAGKTVIVSSNDPQEYSFCRHQLSILDYK